MVVDLFCDHLTGVIPDKGQGRAARQQLGGWYGIVTGGNNDEGVAGEGDFDQPALGVPAGGRDGDVQGLVLNGLYQIFAAIRDHSKPAACHAVGQYGAKAWRQVVLEIINDA